MAETNGRTGPSVKDRLFARACDFDFFQAVRLLEWIASEEQAAGRPLRAAPGGEASPSEEVVRFRVPAASAFAASSVSALKPDPSNPGLPPEMFVWFLGLVGPSGVLPEHYTAAAFARSGDNDDALREFFDVFQHRTVSLFYRAWRKYRLPMELERHLRQQSLSPEQTPTTGDPFSFALRCLVGLGQPGLTGRLHAADETVIYYSGHYSHKCRSALSLQRMLEDYFSLPVLVEPFSGRWLTLPADQRTSLPSSNRPKGAYCALNREAIVGARVWDVQTKFRIRLGPLSYPHFESFLPGGQAMLQLADLVKLYAGPALEFEVQPILKKEEVPTARLKPRAGPQSMIGRTGWLASRPRPKDAEEAIFRVNSLHTTVPSPSGRGLG